MSTDPPTKKSLGQHWLRDENALRAICEAADVQSEDTVLEIGPGLGTLTELLVRRAKSVIAVELDEKLADELHGHIQADNLQVVKQSILEFDLTSLPPNYKIAANIPYYLTSNLIRVISETSNPPAMAVILVQKEVAQRVAARPGDMSLLSVTAQFYWQVSLDREVPAELFEPPPKVDSQILILARHAKPLLETDPQKFFRTVKAGFSQRRKTLLNSLSAGLHLDKEEVKRFCNDAGIDSGRRPQTLSLEEWYSLRQAINT